MCDFHMGFKNHPEPTNYFCRERSLPYWCQEGQLSLNRKLPLEDLLGLTALQTPRSNPVKTFLDEDQDGTLKTHKSQSGARWYLLRQKIPEKKDGLKGNRMGSSKTCDVTSLHRSDQQIAVYLLNRNKFSPKLLLQQIP